MKNTTILATVLMILMCGFQAVARSVSGTKAGHDFVDLGLPSGTLWATQNIGANAIADYGEFFAWGETAAKKEYNWQTYKWCGGKKDSQIKYCISTENGKVDSLIVLQPKDDAATVNWGEGWCMPKYEDQKELFENCSWKWTNDYDSTGVAGRIGTSRINGNTIFLPASGFKDADAHEVKGYYGYYWISNLYTDYSNDAFHLGFNPYTHSCSCGFRYFGCAVRAVVKKE